MMNRDTIRRWWRQGRQAALLCLWTAAFAQVCLAASPAHWRQQQAPAPIVRRSPPAGGLPAMSPGGSPYSGTRAAPIERRAPQRGEHLAQWMSQHSNLTPEQQQQALQREPGFASLPPRMQQRYLNHLAQLNAMNPAKRQRELAHVEAMERLSPEERADVRGVMGQLGSLPMEQRMMVAHTFHALRRLPPEQRIPALNSGQFGPPLSEQQRAVLFNLLRVEPLLYPAPAGPGIQPQPVAPGIAPPQ